LLVSVDPVHAARLTTAELRAIVRAVPTAAGSDAALGELVARQPRGLNGLLRDLVLDERTDQALRLNAVAVLGRDTSQSSRQGLRAALAVTDEEVGQRVIERLGKVGTADDIDLLRGVRTGNRTTQRVLRTAKSFLSYRHRLGVYRIDEPKARLGVDADGGSSSPIRTTTPTSTMLDRMELVPPPIPGIAYVPTPIRRLVCGGGDYALVWNAELAGTGAATLADRQGIPAVLVEFNEETGVYAPAYYLVADPTGRGRARLAGLRGSGRVGLVGTAQVDDALLRFELNATDAPIEHPLTVSGSYDLASGAIRFDVAVVADRFSERQRRQRKQPRPVRPPS
jgi:hypothetical protein